MSDEDATEPPGANQPFKEQLAATGLFGCLYAAFLGLGMAFVVFVGSTLGDCEPGPGCHDNDGAIIGIGLLKVAGIAIVFASIVWAFFAAIRMAIGARLGPFTTNALLFLCMIALLWLTFSPAAELLLMVGR